MVQRLLLAEVGEMTEELLEMTEAGIEDSIGVSGHQNFQICD